MRKYLLLCFLCMTALGMLTSCSLMPEEEALPTIPVIHSYTAEEYELTTVRRGDLVLDATVSCTYMPAKENNLSFAIGGAYIDKVYVQKGDQVKKGQVLAQLAQDNLQDQIAAQKYQLDLLELEKVHIEENRDFDLLKYDIILEDLEWGIEHNEGALVVKLEEQKEEQLEKRAETEKNYAKQLQTAEDAIYLQRLRLAKLDEELAQSQIIADMDGTVTYVHAVSEGQRSVKEQVFITLSDLDSTVFVVEGKSAQYFPEGTEVLIKCQDKEIAARAVALENLDTTAGSEGENVVYLQLEQPDPSLKDGDRGKIRIVLEQSLDTLYVDKDAIGKANGETFVYMLDKDGMRIMQKVTTGLECGDFIEILDGLAENDSVILD